MPFRHDDDVLPNATSRYLADLSSDLRRRRVNRVRVTPLLLQVPLAQLVQRRRSLFAQVLPERTEWGMSVTFHRKVRSTAAHPGGRVVSGRFALVAVDNSLALLVSALTLDAHTSGPHRFCRKAYPLAKRPFFPSKLLGRLVTEMGAAGGWTATAIDAMGYDRARRFRRDMKQQPIEDALAEMREQDRFVHRLEVSFKDDRSVEMVRAAFDRYASVSVRRGDIGSTVSGFVLPAVVASANRDETYSLPIAARPRQQEVLQLSFPKEPFVTRADMNALCEALRKGEGLAVTVIHLNPYLQAQVVDMLTGAAVDMVVLDNTHVSLIPRAERSELSLERMTTTLFRYFGEGELNKVPIA